VPGTTLALVGPVRGLGTDTLERSIGRSPDDLAGRGNARPLVPTDDRLDQFDRLSGVYP
jgi:hypothetical protein